MKFIFYNALPICFLGLAAVIIICDREGWGWCVLAALLSGVTFSTNSDDCKCGKDKNEHRKHAKPLRPEYQIPEEIKASIPTKTP